MLGPVILVFGRDLLSIVLLLLASGIDDKGTGLMASRFGAGKQESDLLENLGKKYQQNPDASCQKRKHSRWKPARNLLFYIFLLVIATNRVLFYRQPRTKFSCSLWAVTVAPNCLSRRWDGARPPCPSKPGRSGGIS